MNSTTQYTTDRLDRMAAEYRRLQHRYADSRLGDERGDRAYAKMEEMCQRLEATGQLDELLTRLR
jgi:hypothetical protein